MLPARAGRIRPAAAIAAVPQFDQADI